MKTTTNGLSSDVKKQIVNEYQNTDSSAREVATKYNIHISTVFRYVRESKKVDSSICDNLHSRRNNIDKILNKYCINL